MRAAARTEGTQTRRRRACAPQTPVASLAREITTPGPGQLRALITVCGNPATTGPGADRIRHALGRLDVLVCLAEPGAYQPMICLVAESSPPWAITGLRVYTT
jgi:anaerobic selenocysteine-containing dehydrogenase